MLDFVFYMVRGATNQGGEAFQLLGLDTFKAFEEFQRLNRLKLRIRSPLCWMKIVLN